MAEHSLSDKQLQQQLKNGASEMCLLPLLSKNDNSSYPFEKIFPVYAMDVSSPDSDCIINSLDDDLIWEAVQDEAKYEAVKEPILSSFLYASILSHDCLEQALSFVLANRLHNTTLLATQLLDTFLDVIMHHTGIRRAIRLDVQAFMDRDPACLSYCTALLYLKGYHSLQSYRVAHVLWNTGHKVLALALQSRISEVFGVDIHPGISTLFFWHILLILLNVKSPYTRSSRKDWRRNIVGSWNRRGDWRNRCCW
ncbi:Probable serine acetyltransferase 2 [Linum perenne]